MVSTERGKVPVEVFTSFVRKAIDQRWFKEFKRETGE
jgi:hypothetical protein